MLRSFLMVGIGVVAIGILASCSPLPAREVKKPVRLKPNPSGWDSVRTTLPIEFVDATRFLLNHGFGDPRRGEYRRLRVVIGAMSEQEGTPVNADGWFFPSEPGKPARAVCLNGLVYEPLDHGSVADLEADVKEALNHRASHSTSTGTEQISAGVDDFMTDSAAALVLISGRHDLAEKIEAQRTTLADEHGFMRLARRFLTLWWDQAVTAHLRGDERNAFRNAVLIQKFRLDYERQAKFILGSSWVQQMSQPSMGGTGTFEAFPFIDHVEDLVNDCARRLDLGTRQTLDWTTLNKLSQAERITALIDRLDDFQARGAGRATAPSTGTDPIFAAIVKENRAALPALLDTMDNDTRLTRAVKIGTDRQRAPILISVKDIARLAIGSILNWVNITNISGQPATTQQIREFLVKNSTGTKADDWFNVLADEQATPEQWLNAAQSLFQVSPPLLRQQTDRSAALQVQGPPVVKLVADLVRLRENPSLADLIKRRVNQLLDDSAQDPSDTDSEVAIAMQLATFLTQWDRDNALPLLARASNTAMTNHSGSKSQTDRLIPQAIELRVAMVDKTALYEYSQWLTSMQSTGLGTTDPRVFEPLLANSDSPDLRGLPEKLFLDNDSGMNLIKLAIDSPDKKRIRPLIVSPLIQLLAVQKAISQLLKNKDSLGSLTIDNSTTFTIVFSSSNNLLSVHSNKLQGDPLGPKPGDYRGYRVCDSIASYLSALRGAPEIEPYWPDQAKDASIGRLVSYLAKNANHLSGLVPSPENWKERSGVITDALKH